MLTFSCLLPACLLIHTLAQLCRLDHSTMKNSTGIFIHRTWWFVLWKQLKYRVKIGIQDRTKMKTICKNIQETFSLGVFCCFIKTTKSLDAFYLFACEKYLLTHAFCTRSDGKDFSPRCHRRALPAPAAAAGPPFRTADSSRAEGDPAGSCRPPAPRQNPRQSPVLPASVRTSPE